MYQIIAPTLFHTKRCRLPGIGTLEMLTSAASVDFINNTIHPPAQQIQFKSADKFGNDFNEFSAISELLHKELEEHGHFFLKGIGNFTREETGKIQFTAVTLHPALAQPVIVNRVTRRDASHPLLVGDQQTTNVEMTGFLNEPATSKSNWWMGAAILAAIGIAVLCYYVYKNGFYSFGNALPI